MAMTPEHLSSNCLVEYLCVCVMCLHVLMQVRGFQHAGSLLDLLGCSGSVAAADSLTSLVRFTATTGSQLAFSSPLMSLADPRQMLWGTGV